MLNRNLILPASPGLARRILNVPNITNIDIDPKIVALAKEGLLTEEDFSPFDGKISPRGKALIQQLLDCDLRAVVAIHKNKSKDFRLAILAATVLNDVRKILIGCDETNIHEWENAAKQLDLDFSTTLGSTDRVLIVPVMDVLSQDAVGSRRTGVTILDSYDNDSRNFNNRFFSLNLFRDLSMEIKRVVFLREMISGMNFSLLYDLNPDLYLADGLNTNKSAQPLLHHYDDSFIFYRVCNA